VIVSDRELNDTTDVFRCFDAETGRDVWTVRYIAPGKLDYGNSPRATPLIHEGRVFLYGAMGHLTCAELASGRVVWRIDVRDDFDVAESLPWGSAALR
jgi:outer membrane protein assembly factor BamB